MQYSKYFIKNMDRGIFLVSMACLESLVGVMSIAVGYVLFGVLALGVCAMLLWFAIANMTWFPEHCKCYACGRKCICNCSNYCCMCGKRQNFVLIRRWGMRYQAQGKGKIEK